MICENTKSSYDTELLTQYVETLQSLSTGFRYRLAWIHIARVRTIQPSLILLMFAAAVLPCLLTL